MAVTAANNLSFEKKQPRTASVGTAASNFADKIYHWVIPLLILRRCLSGTYLKFMVRILSGTVIQYYPSRAIDYTIGPMEGSSV